MPLCTLINAIASFKKSLARLKAYSSVASLARCYTCKLFRRNRIISFHVHAESPQSLQGHVQAQHKHIQAPHRHHQQCLEHIACKSYECLSARSSMQLRHSKSRLRGSRPIHPWQVLQDVIHASCSGGIR